MQHGERYLGKRNRAGPYNADSASGNLICLIVSHNECAGPRMAMNRFVRLEDLLVRQGVLAMVVLLPCVVLGQQVPDAPTPQVPDSLGNITSGVTPGKGAPAPQDQNANPTQPPAATGTQ